MKMKLSILSAAILAVLSSPSNAESFSLSAGNYESDEDVVFDSTTYTTSITGTANATFNGNFSSTSQSSNANSWNSAVLVDGGDSRTNPVLNLGSESTNNINITSKGPYTIGLWAWKSGQINVNGDTLTVNVTADATSVDDAAAYGIIAQNNSVPADGRTNKATIIINAENTYVTADYIGSPSDDSAVAALLAMSEGVLKVNGNLKAKAPSVITARGNSVVAINEKNLDKIIQLDGDINFNYDKSTSQTSVDANVIVNLTNPESYWSGNTKVTWGTGKPEDASKLEVHDAKLSLSNGAQWNVSTVIESDTSESGTQYTPLNLLNIDAGIVNLTENTTQSITIEKMTGSGGTINLLAATEDGKTIESGTVGIDSAEEGIVLAVNAVGITADDINDDEAALQSINDKVSNGVTKTNTVAEGDIRGTISQTFDQAGEAVGEVTRQENTKLLSFRGVNAASLVAWRDEVAYTNQRMEYLRDNTHAFGAWAQVYGGESSYDDATVDLTTTTVQVGADATIGDWIAGAAFSYSKGDADMANGSADTDSYTLSLYTARNFDSGFYVNGLARYGRLSTDATAGNMTASYDNNAFSIGGNVGYRFNFAQQAFVEPNFGLQYAYVMGDDYTATNGVKVEQDDFDALIASLGARVGFNFAEDAGKIYARASVNHDFLGEVDGTASKAGLADSMYVDLGGTWVTYGIGTQFNFTENLSVWGNIDRTTGGEVSTHYMMNAGLRYVF